jgi:hypothetical protein
MKARDSIICLALLSLSLVLGDGVQHFGKVLMARVTLRNIKPDDENWENVHDAMRDQCWLVAKDVVVMAAQGIVIFLVMKWQPNRVGGGIAPPASHTTGHAGPRPAVPGSPDG